MFNRRAIGFLVAVTVLLAGAWGVRLFFTQEPLVPLDDTLVTVDPSFISPEELTRLISVYEERITQVTTPSDYLILGGLYLEAARTTGDLSRYEAARSMFQTADDLRPADLGGRIGLARTQYSLHEFDAARRTIEGVLTVAPGRADALALQADIQTAIGDLDAAAESLRGVAAVSDPESPGLLIRRAQLEWVQGGHEQAMELTERALNGVPDRQPRVRSWYEGFGAQMAFRVGDLDRAEELGEAAFDHDPEAFLSKVTLARVVAPHEPQRAIELYEQATETFPEPEYLAALGDLRAAQGDQEAAAAAYDTVMAIADLARAQGTVYDRQIVQFFADHDLETDRAIAMATAELEIRRDPQAYDLLGWALYRAGRLDEAAEAAATAAATGYRSAHSLFHSGLIAAARGDEQTARADLRAALDLNPEFDPLLGPQAERVLADLGS